MEPVSLYSKNYQVEVDHVDFSGSLKLSSLFTYFQDIAGIHAENLGMGMETLYEKHNALWVLARIRVDIVRYPLWNEEITIDTWPQEPGKIKFTRDFLVKDGQWNILDKAVSTWVIIDVNRHLNNSKYVDFIMDCFSLNDHEKHSIRSIEINYSLE